MALCNLHIHHRRLRRSECADFLLEKPPREVVVCSPQDVVKDVESCARKDVKREQSLRRSNDFERLYREGLRVRLCGFVFYFLKTGDSLCRLGIVASRKVGCAVVRNRFRRRVRCLYALLQENLKGHNAIVIATSPCAVESSFSQLRELFLKALERLSFVKDDDRVSA